MPNKKSRKDDQPTAKDFQKRRTYEQGRALMDTAHLAVQRLYSDAFGFWRRCKKKPCRRNRRCCGNQTACLMQGLPFVPPAERVKAEKEVIAGGPRRVPPASHAEWVVRRSALRDLISWGFGSLLVFAPPREARGRMKRALSFLNHRRLACADRCCPRRWRGPAPARRAAGRSAWSGVR